MERVYDIILRCLEDSVQLSFFFSYLSENKLSLSWRDIYLVIVAFRLRIVVVSVWTLFTTFFAADERKKN